MFIIIITILPLLNLHVNITISTTTAAAAADDDGGGGGGGVGRW